MERVKEPRAVEAPSDDALIVRAQAGDREAFGRLVERYQKRVYFLARRMARDHDAADDIAQEAFVRAWFAIGSFTRGRSFYTWIYRICVNLAINHLKRAKTTVPASRFGDGADPLERESGAPDASATLASAEAAARLEKLVDALSAKYKAVLVLRIHDEMSYEDIARTLDISVGTVMSRLFRAREKLRAALEKEER